MNARSKKPALVFNITDAFLLKSVTSNNYFLVTAVVPAVPDHVPYLIVGAGTSSVAAFRAIKARDAKAKVSYQLMKYES